MVVDIYQTLLDMTVRKDSEPRCEFYFSRAGESFLKKGVKPSKLSIFDVDGTLSPNYSKRWIEGLLYYCPRMREHESELMNGFILLQKNDISEGLSVVRRVFIKSGLTIRQNESAEYYAVENSELYKGVRHGLDVSKDYGYFSALDTTTTENGAKLLGEMKLGIDREFAEGTHIIFDENGIVKDLILNVDAEKVRRQNLLLKKHSKEKVFKVVLEDDPVQNISYLFSGGFDPLILLDLEKFSKVPREKISTYTVLYPELRDDFTKLPRLLLRIERWYLQSLMKTEEDLNSILTYSNLLRKASNDFISTGDEDSLDYFVNSLEGFLKKISPFFPERGTDIKNLILRLFTSTDLGNKKQTVSKITGLIDEYTEF